MQWHPQKAAVLLHTQKHLLLSPTGITVYI